MVVKFARIFQDLVATRAGVQVGDDGSCLIFIKEAEAVTVLEGSRSLIERGDTGKLIVGDNLAHHQPSVLPGALWHPVNADALLPGSMLAVFLSHADRI